MNSSETEKKKKIWVGWLREIEQPPWDKMSRTAAASGFQWLAENTNSVRHEVEECGGSNEGAALAAIHLFELIGDFMRSVKVRSMVDLIDEWLKKEILPDWWKFRSDFVEPVMIGICLGIVKAGEQLMSPFEHPFEDAWKDKVCNVVFSRDRFESIKTTFTHLASITGSQGLLDLITDLTDTLDDDIGIPLTKTIDQCLSWANQVFPELNIVLDLVIVDRMMAAARKTNPGAWWVRHVLTPEEVKEISDRNLAAVYRDWPDTNSTTEKFRSVNIGRIMMDMESNTILTYDDVAQ